MSAAFTETEEINTNMLYRRNLDVCIHGSIITLHRQDKSRNWGFAGELALKAKIVLSAGMVISILYTRGSIHYSEKVER